MGKIDEEWTTIAARCRPIGGWIVAILTLSILIGCNAGSAGATPSRVPPTSLPVPTPLPPLPTLPPAGSDSNPLRMVMVTPDPAGVAQAADALGDGLTGDLRLVVEVRVTDQYNEARAALCDGSAVAVSLDAFGYLAASQEGCGTAHYLLEREGAVSSQGQFVARDAFLPESYRGVFCRPDGSSLNGWIIPTITLRTRGVDPFTDMFSIVDAGSDAEVVRMIDSGTCGLGATSLGAQNDLGGLNFPERLRVLEELTPVPNDAVVLSSHLDDPTRALIQDGLAAHAAEFASLLDASALQPADDAAFDGLRALFASAGIDPSALGQ